MRLRTRMATVGTALALLGAVGVLPGAAAANAAPSASNTAAVAHAKKPAQTTLPVAGTLGDGTAFTGALSNLKTKVVGKTLTLTGTITGTGLPAGGAKFATPIAPRAGAAIAGLQAAVPQAACPILGLDLGPLHLDVLGLVIDLNEVILDITAVPGAGNLLGNLLCAVAGLLDGGGPLGQIAALLNQLLTGLGL